MRCSQCGREERVNFAHCLRFGWPSCHGYTMTLQKTDADIDAAVGEVIALGKVADD